MATRLGRGTTALVGLLLAVAPAAHAAFGVTNTWGQFGVPPSAYSPYGIATGTDGTSYVIDQQLGEIVKFDATGSAVVAFGRGFFGSSAQNIAVDTARGTVYVADRSNNRVQRFSAAGTFLGTWSAALPADVDVDSAGNAYIVESTNARVVKRAPDGTQLAIIGGLGTGNGQLSGPSAVALDAANNVYVADTGNNRIEQFGTDGAYVRAWPVTAPSVLAIGGSSVFVGRAATIDRFTLTGTSTATWTSGLTTIRGLSAKGTDLLVTQSSKATITDLASDGTTAATWTFDGLGDGHGAFRGAYNMARAANGDIYVVDQSNYRVQRFSATGTYIGSIGSGPGGGNGQFNPPTAVAVSPTTGDVYVSDANLDRIQRFTAAGAFVSVIATGGTGPGQVDSPFDLAFAADGTLYVSETGNDRIQHLSATGGYLDSFPGGAAGITVAPDGTLYLSYQSTHIDHYSPGGALLGSFGSVGAPYFFAYAVDVSVAPDGDVYVVDWSSDKVTRTAADGTFKESFSGGFDYPRALLAAPNGYVYVSDYNLNRVQRFGQPPAAPAAPVPSTALTKGALAVTWSTVTDPNGDSVTYTLQRERANAVTSVLANTAGTTYTKTAGDPESEGRLRFRVVAGDGTLSSTSAWSDYVTVDRTPPVAVITASRLPEYGADWFKDDASLSFATSYDPVLPDGSAGSGVDATTVPAAASRSTSGDLTSAGTVSDLAGNVSASASKTVHVDADPPLLGTTATAGGAPYVAGDWTVAAVTVDGACSDGQSGVAGAPTPVVFDAETATGNAQRTCVDNVGHSTQASFIPVRIDRTAPAAPTVTPDRAPDSGGFYRDTVTLTFAGAGDLLGDGLTPGVGVDPATVPAPQTVTTNGSTVVSGTVKDLLGHTSASGSRTVKVDASPPTLALSCPDTVVQDATATGDATASDAESGLVGPATATVALDTSTTGAHTGKATAQDAVGHETEATCAYTVTAKPVPPPLTSASTTPVAAPAPITTPTPVPDTRAPAVTITTRSVRLKGGALTLGITTDEPAKATITLIGRRGAKTVQLARLTVALKPATRQVKLKLSRRTLKLLRRARNVKIKVVVTDAAGNTTRPSTSLTLAAH